ncbi:unnamed protein product, partial [Peniophora sp. CBMAI 1063]
SKDQNWMTDVSSVPSWHWPRCGLPNGTHTDPGLRTQILTWLGREDFFVDTTVQKARSRETGLAVLLKAALIYSDFQHIADQNFDHGGVQQLRTSTILEVAGELEGELTQWVAEQASLLEALLPQQGFSDDDEEDADLPYLTVPESAHPEDANPVLPTSRRRPLGSESPPPSLLAAPFQAIQLSQLSTTETVGQFRAAMNAEPLSAAQVYSRQGLENIADEPLRREANRRIRGARKKDGDRQTSSIRKPAHQRQRPDFPTAGDDIPSDSSGHGPPPPKRPKRHHPQPKRIGRPETAGTQPQERGRQKRKSGTASRGRRGRRKGSSSPKPAQMPKPGASRKRGRRALPDSDADDEAQIADSNTSRRHDVVAPHDSDQEMPTRISKSLGKATSGRAQPVLFSAGASTASALDTDELDAARSPRPVRRGLELAFIQANPIGVRLPEPTTFGSPGQAGAQRVLRSQAVAGPSQTRTRQRPKARPVVKKVPA